MGKSLHSITATDRKRFFWYGGLLLIVALAYAGIRAFGNTLPAPAPASPVNGISRLPQVHVNDFLHVLLALALVITAARALGAVFNWIHQPPVVGEMIAGILLGPSLLGHLAPNVAAFILPLSIAPLLNVISQFGVILYMFLVGLDVDISSLRQRAHSTIAISHASIVMPFLLGAMLALLLYPNLSNSSVSFTAFSLFLGVSMSVTAFPVLARILTDRRIHRTKMGALALACAAVDDVTAWCLLAFVVSVTQSHAGTALHTIVMALVYIAVMFLLIRPLVAWLTGLLERRGRLTQGALAFVLLGILFSCLATESIGIHAIFGAFVLGALIPQGSLVARELAARLEDFVIVFLLPAFFAFTGLRTQIGLVSGPRQWLFCLLIVAVASIGKFGGSAIAARLSGLSWRDSSALGVLMNTRGLMELIVLNIGLELHIISPLLFAMLVIMALTTTLATSPLLHFIAPRRFFDAELHRVGDPAAERIGALIAVSSTAGIAGLIDIAIGLSTSGDPAPRVLALNPSRSSGDVTPKMHETDGFTPSQSPVLAAALDAAWSRGIAIKPEAVWTNDAASDIVLAVGKTNVRWLLLESSRSILGKYPRRSIVNKVMDRLASQPMNVAVLAQSGGLHRSPVACILHRQRDGRPALQLAGLLAQGQSPVQVLTVEPSDWLPNAVPLSRDGNFSQQIPAGLVVIAKDIVDSLDLSLDQLTGNRSIIVVQGGASQRTNPVPQQASLEAVATPS